jgi:O-antigen/teichoic acid export membrane protein
MNPVSEIAIAPTASAGRRIAKNAVWLLLGRVGAQALAMLFAILVARRLGEAGLGQYATITSVIFLGNLTTTFGTDMLIIRELAGKRDLSMLPAALLVQLALSLPFIAIVFFLAPYFPNQDTQTIQALHLYSLALVPLAFFSVFSSALRGFERMDTFTWLNLANGAVLILLAAFALTSTSSIITLAWLLLIAQCVSALLAGWFCLSQIPAFAKAWRTSRSAVTRLLRLSAPIAVLALLGALYQRMAIFQLSALRGAVDTGIFSAALRLMEAAKIGHVAILSAMFPAMSQAAIVGSKPDEYRAMFRSALIVLLGLSLVLALALFSFANPLLTILYGAQFSASAPALRALAWVLLPMAVSHYLSLQLLAQAAERAIMLALAVSTLALAAAIWFALPAFGLPGVGWSMLAAEILQATILLIAWQRGKKT